MAGQLWTLSLELGQGSLFDPHPCSGGEAWHARHSAPLELKPRSGTCSSSTRPWQGSRNSGLSQNCFNPALEQCLANPSPIPVHTSLSRYSKPDRDLSIARQCNVMVFSNAKVLQGIEGSSMHVPPKCQSQSTLRTWQSCKARHGITPVLEPGRDMLFRRASRITS